METIKARWRRVSPALGPVIIGVPAALAIVACQSGSSGTPAATGAAASSASAAAASARAIASSSAGAAAKSQAVGLADDCKPAGGFDVLEPGVPGADAARKTFESCESIPKSKLFALGLCLVRAYSHAPAKAAEGTPEETTRQAYLADDDGACVQTAKGHKPVTPPSTPAASPHPAASRS